jgi:hypothetical protein
MASGQIEEIGFLVPGYRLCNAISEGVSDLAECNLAIRVITIGCDLSCKKQDLRLCNIGNHEVFKRSQITQILHLEPICVRQELNELRACFEDVLLNCNIRSDKNIRVSDAQ